MISAKEIKQHQAKQTWEKTTKHVQIGVKLQNTALLQLQQAIQPLPTHTRTTCYITLHSHTRDILSSFTCTCTTCNSNTSQAFGVAQLLQRHENRKPRFYHFQDDIQISLQPPTWMNVETNSSVSLEMRLFQVRYDRRFQWGNWLLLMSANIEVKCSKYIRVLYGQTAI